MVAQILWYSLQRSKLLCSNKDTQIGENAYMTAGWEVGVANVQTKGPGLSSTARDL